MDKETKVKVNVSDLAFVLCRVHNLLNGIGEQSLLDRLRGKTPVDALDERIRLVKKDIIKMLSETTENGFRLEPSASPYYWQPEDIIKQLGGLK